MERTVSDGRKRLSLFLILLLLLFLIYSLFIVVDIIYLSIIRTKKKRTQLLMPASDSVRDAVHTDTFWPRLSTRSFVQVFGLIVGKHRGQLHIFPIIKLGKTGREGHRVDITMYICKVKKGFIYLIIFVVFSLFISVLLADGREGCKQRGCGCGRG